uniref:Nuclear protein 1 n=1 Tax=Callorhinus ursinus TaxID=34884 RepID=A0A3Q7MSB5_CALUR|nr:nuclear protein 1 [Callorhinus ursinus]
MASLPRAASPARQPPGPEDEDPSLDEYDLCSLAHSYLGPLLGCTMPPFASPQPLAWFPGGGGRKGRTKREAAANTNRPSPGGHERKLVTKLQNTERKKRGARS